MKRAGLLGGASYTPLAAQTGILAAVGSVRVAGRPAVINIESVGFTGTRPMTELPPVGAEGIMDAVRMATQRPEAAKELRAGLLAQQTLLAELKRQEGGLFTRDTKSPVTSLMGLPLVRDETVPPGHFRLVYPSGRIKEVRIA